ncbi:hypothetical protein ABIE26_001464 [Pedobacter africanus]
MRGSFFGGAGSVILMLAFITIGWKPIDRKVVKDHIVTDSNTIHYTRARTLYETAELAASGLSFAVLEKALTGYYNLKNTGRLSDSKSILSIADFDQNSTSKRLWIVDLEQKKLVLNTWVAHGERSGADKATFFSNTSESLKSSIGFFITGESYYGKHGLSLRLDGMDEGFNSNARKRSIVLHGADYVSQATINALGRLGRSQGCPAVPQELAGMVVRTLEEGTVLFINVSEQNYTSRYLVQDADTVLASK